MKKTILTIATTLVFALSSFATTTSKPEKLNDVKTLLNTYIDVISNGTTNLNKLMYSKDFKFENTTSGKMYGKKQYLKFLNENKGVKYNCVTKSELLEHSNDTALAKTTRKFENFTRVDHVYLKQTKDGWKICKIVSSYL